MHTDRHTHTEAQRKQAHNTMTRVDGWFELDWIGCLCLCAYFPYIRTSSICTYTQIQIGFFLPIALSLFLSDASLTLSSSCSVFLLFATVFVYAFTECVILCVLLFDWYTLYYTVLYIYTCMYVSWNMTIDGSFCRTYLQCLWLVSMRLKTVLPH